jgi:hypothetical protein
MSTAWRSAPIETGESSEIVALTAPSAQRCRGDLPMAPAELFA